jgi:N,N'-diacetyllegionaminate synthase
MSINIGSRKIGNGCPAYIVAEIGINHNGDMELAKKTILAAKNAGADAVKFQSYKTEDFVPLRTVEYEYISQGKVIREYQYDMFKRYELSEQNLIDLKDFCDKNSIDFHSTPTNCEGVDLLKKIGVGVLKNGSDYLTNLEIIEYMGKSGLPAVLSTGMALASEIDDAARSFRDTGNDQLILLHCTSRYPTPAEEVNLKKINTLRDTFGCVVGFSDHSEGVWAAVGSIIYGACWIEKHFTLDIDLPGPDHRFSSDPKDFMQYVDGIRYIEKAMGISYLGPTAEEEKSRESFRLSCAAGKDFKEGDIINENDIIFIRPGTGIPPKNKHYLVGKALQQNTGKGTLLDMSYIS